VVNDGERTLVGTPYVEGASVTGKIVAQRKARKVTVFKYKRRKDSKKKKGHRQSFTSFLSKRSRWRLQMAHKKAEEAQGMVGTQAARGSG